jgi:uncharacterized protein (TIGR01777 family)
MRVFVTGASGLIGRALSAALLERGDEVTALTRQAGADLPRGALPVVGDPTVTGPWLEALGRADAVVHLSGEPVAGGRWTAERKARIASSRLDSTRLVAAAVAAGGPTTLVQGSAVGFYGDRGDEQLDEAAAPGRGFLADLSVRWEEAAALAAARARVVLVRTGIVLARQGGALPQLARPFKLFAGGPLGDGKAWQPWIHLADQVGLLLLALDDPRASGPLNAVAPGAVQQAELARTLARVLHRPNLLPVPGVALRLAVGEMAEVLLASQRVLPARAEALGYRFRFATLGAALEDLLG